MAKPEEPVAKLGRRAFLKGTTALLMAAGVQSQSPLDLFAEDNGKQPAVRFGLVTDVHYADRPPAGTRNYRESLAKLARASEQFTKDRVDFVAELGDFIDSAPSLEEEQGFLGKVNEVFAAMPGKKHYVLGNHCVRALTKGEFLELVGRKDSFYSFDVGKFHFVVADACFRSDGVPYGRGNFDWKDAYVADSEIEWLKADLATAKKPTVVFVHQRLDEGNPYGAKNASQVRELFAQSGHVLAVFQGHHHKNDYREIGGVHFCTMMAVIEGTGPVNNAFARVDVFEGGALKVEGFLRQKSYALA